MQIGQYSSLKDFAAHAPRQDKAFAEQLGTAGQQIVDTAIRTYRDGNRTPEQADRSVADLTDLERAMKALIDRTISERAANNAALTARIADANANGVTRGELKPGSTEDLHNTTQMSVPGYSAIGSGYWSGSPAQIEKGTRTWTAEVVSGSMPADDAMAGIRKFIKDLHDVSGLYAAAVSVPGPATLTVANFAREEASASVHQSSSASVSGSSQSHGNVLLGLLASGGGSSQMSGSSASRTDGQYTYDRTSTDERLIPQMRDLADRLDQIAVVPAAPAQMTAKQGVSETRVVTEHHVFKTTERTEPLHFVRGGGSGDDVAYVSRSFGTMPGEPEHVSVPLTGVSNYS